MSESSVLVLNKFGMPIDKIDPVRAAVLILLEKAVSLKDNPEKQIRSPSWAIDVPEIIQMLNCRYVYQKSIPYSRRQVFKRDNNTCVRCGTQERSSLTIEHIIPRSRFEAINRERNLPYRCDSFENCVVLCRKCNQTKGNRLPEEIGWKLVGVRPTTFGEYGDWWEKLVT